MSNISKKVIEPYGKVIIGDSRKMGLIEDESIDFIVTSPPYWHIKDYGVEGQIGYGQTLHEYLKDLYTVWSECYRVLRPGRRMCINVGDQFARSVIYGRYKIIPIHAEIISQCEDIGFDYMGSIIWQKKTTMNTTGGANVMGSYPYPPNGMIEIDYEFILIFKKPGKTPVVSKEIKELSKLEKNEWKEYFSGHWYFPGAKQVDHEAMFPEELPRRLIKMYTFVGETVLDPFLGSGTTLKVALELRRNGVGYEINKDYVKIIKEKLGIENSLFKSYVEFLEDKIIVERAKRVDYVPKVKDAKPLIEPSKMRFANEKLYKVVEILDEKTLRLDTGLIVEFLGLDIIDKEKTVRYLSEFVLKKEVFLKFETNDNIIENNKIQAYVFLKNKIFLNAYLIKSGLAVTKKDKSFKYLKKFIQLEEEALNGKKRVDIEHSNK